VSGSRTGWRFSEGAETSTRAAPKPRTGITDSGYNAPWRSAKIFAGVAYTPAAITATVTRRRQNVTVA